MPVAPPARKASGESTGMGAPLRASMERSFGADFSDVRVHPESPRASALGALAFTQGRDIHVAPGRWSPQTERGRALLGHELTHVLQQRAGRVRATMQQKGVGLNTDPALEAEADAMGERAAAGRSVRGPFARDGRSSGPAPAGAEMAAPVQRKIGFEFQTNARVKRGPIDAYSGPIFLGVYFKAEGDNGDLEFITDPLSEDEAGERVVVRTLGLILKWCEALAQLAGKETSVRCDEVTRQSGILEKDDELDEDGVDADGREVWVWPVKNIVAKPQATVGVGLENIGSLLDRLARQDLTTKPAEKQGGDQETKEVEATGSSWSKMARVSTEVSKVVDAMVAGAGAQGEGARLKGMLSLVVSYIWMGDHATDVLPYSKAIAPLMSRRSFYDMYRLLSEQEKKLFKPAYAKALEALSLDAEGDMYPRKFKIGSNSSSGPKRKDWIESIINGSAVGEKEKPAVPGKGKGINTDLMSTFSGSDVEVSSPSMGQFSQAAVDFYNKQSAPGEAAKVTVPEEDQARAIVELRSLPNEVPLQKWPWLAINLLRLYRQVEPKKKK